MKHKDLAKFFKVTIHAVNRWSSEKKRRASIEAEAGADKEMQSLLSELQRLAFVYNCANVVGANQPLSCTVIAPTAGACSVSFYQQGFFDPYKKIFINLDACDAVAQLKKAKLQLEHLTYGSEADVR